MAIECFLHLRTEKTVEEVLTQWFADDSYPLEMLEDGSPKYMLANYSCLQVSVSHRQHKRKLGILGFLPTTTMIFRLPKVLESKDLAFEIIKRTTIRWLQKTEDPLVLLFNNDIGMLARSSEGIIVNPGWWTQQELDDLPFDFTEQVIDTAMYDWEGEED